MLQQAYLMGVVDNIDTKKTKDEKAVACALNGFAFLFFLLNIAVLNGDITQRAYYGAGLSWSGISYLWYILKKDMSSMYWMLCVTSCLLGPLIAVDLRNSGGALFVYRGMWLVPQLAVAQAIPYMGGTTWFAICALICNVASFFVILVVEVVVIGVQPMCAMSQEQYLGVPLISVFLVMLCQTLYRLLSSQHEEQVDHTASFHPRMSDLMTITISGPDERRNSESVASSIEVLPLPSPPQVHHQQQQQQLMFTDGPLVSIHAPTTASNPISNSLLATHRDDSNTLQNHHNNNNSLLGLGSILSVDASLVESNTSSSRKPSSSTTRLGSVFSDQSSRRKSSATPHKVHVQLSTLIFVTPFQLVQMMHRVGTAPLRAREIITTSQETRLEELCDNSNTNGNATLIEKYTSILHRCVKSYDGNILWVNGLDVVIQFVEVPGKVGVVQAAVNFAHNLANLCKHQSEMLQVTCTLSRGEVIGNDRKFKGSGCNFFYGFSGVTSRCNQMATAIEADAGQLEGVRVIGDETLLDQLPEGSLKPITLSSLNFVVFAVHPPSETTYLVSADGRDELGVTPTNSKHKRAYLPWPEVPSRVGSVSTRSNSIRFSFQRDDDSSPRYSKSTDSSGSPPHSFYQEGLGTVSVVCDVRQHVSERMGSMRRISRYRPASIVDPGLMQLHTSLKGCTPALDVRKIPFNFPEEAWETWLDLDSNRSGELSAEELWNFFTKLGLKMSAERFFDFLEQVDTDGTCTISMQEFADAYEGTLGGMVLMSRIKRFGQGLTAEGLDPGLVVLDAWQRILGTRTLLAAEEDVLRVLTQVGVETSVPQVNLMMKELDEDNAGLMHINDLLAFFLPEMTKNEVEKLERLEAVTRVATTTSGAQHETAEQAIRREAILWGQKYDFYCSLVLLPYVLYSVVEATLSCGLWYHPDLIETELARSIASSVLEIIPLSWICAKAYVPREVAGQHLVTQAEVRRHYFWSVDFVIDVICAFPVEIIGTVLSANHYNFSFLLRLDKILMLYYINTFYGRVTVNWNASLSRIIQTFLWWVLIIHFFACAFLSLCPSQPSRDIIAISNFATDTPAVLMYAQAFDWAMKLMVGLNRGAPLPTSDAFLGLSLAVVVLGVVLFSVIVTIISNALNVRDASALFADKIEETRAFFEEAHISEDVTTDVILYYRHMFQTLGTTQPETHNPLSDLPPELGIRVGLSHSHVWLSHVRVLQPLLKIPASIYEVNRALRPVVVRPGEFLSRKGMAILAMYVLTYGKLIRYSIVRQVTKHADVLHVGDAVNEYGLLNNVKSIYNVMVPHDGYANVFELTKIDFTNVMNMFPEAQSEVRESINALIHEIVLFSSERLTDGGDGVDLFFKRNEAQETTATMHHVICDRIAQGMVK